MFEYFTEKAIAVIMAAQEEARRLGHRSVGTEQILLGLIRVEGSLAARVLADLGVTLQNARVAVEQIVGRENRSISTEIPFTPKAAQIFESAFEQAHTLNQMRQRLNQIYIAPEHLLLSLVQGGDSVAATGVSADNVAVKVLTNLGIDLNEVRDRIIAAAEQQAANPPDNSASGNRAGGDYGAETGTPIFAGAQERGSAGRSSRTGKALEEYGRNLTQLALDDQLDPMVGRQKELERVVQILGRRTKSNPVLLGEPGVGKTAIAEGLAQRIANRQVPDLLFDKQLISLDMGALLSGTRFRGEFEERLNQVIAEVRQAKNVILMIDEIHTLVGAGGTEGGMDAANLFKPALARGEFQVLGATTLDEYRRHIERDAALERRFQPVIVEAPSVGETIEILWGLRDRYEQHHRVRISNEALEASARLSDRYIADRFLPDKAIDLIDEAGSLVHLRHSQQSPLKKLKRELRQIKAEKEAAAEAQDFEQAGQLRDREMALEAQIKTAQARESGVGESSIPGHPSAVSASLEQPSSGKPSLEQSSSEQSSLEQQSIPLSSSLSSSIVTVEDIAHIVASWTGIPANKLTESESVLLLHLEEMLHNRIVGQEEAVTAVARAVRRARVGLGDPERPIASFIFSGPTGVGKTELAKALAAAVFGSEEAMIRLDMSEYMESHTVSKLIGAPPGYVGYDEAGQLTEAVRRKPYTVILLDEIEKAHPDVFNLLLQLLEDGRLTDAKGRTVSFKNTLLIMTSNIGSKVIEKGGGGLGFALVDGDSAIAQYQQIHDRIQDEMKQYFRPELLNRLDDIIVFRQLKRDEVKQIADLLLQEVTTRLNEQAIRLELTEAFKERLVVDGYSSSYGARPLRRAIARLLEDNLAEAMLAGQIKAGDTAIVDIDDDGQVQIQQQPALVAAEVGL